LQIFTAQERTLPDKYFMNAQDKLDSKNSEGKFICVGLDTHIEKIPQHLQPKTDAVVQFNQKIIEATAALAAAYKINLAFYEKDGEQGIINLRETLSLIPDDILIIADGKRGDIGNTSKMSTLNPLMGKDSVQPFLDFTDKLHFILALTSNPGSADFQKALLKNGNFIYQQIIKKVLEWNSNNNCGIVFGATNLDELEKNIDLIGTLPILIPGVGAQGGMVEEIIPILKKRKNGNFLINASRGIIYKSIGNDFAEKASNELGKLNSKITALF
jgi:orotidine-5'-phosphate decarboxylase